VTLLLVEDEERVRRLSRRTLERAGLRVLFTSGYPTHPCDPVSGLPSSCSFLAKPFTTAALRDAVREVLTD
jgi:DNA-binding response OmpR family regulator